MSVLSYACEGLVAYFLLGAVTTAASRFIPRARHLHATVWRQWLFGTLGGIISIATAILAEIYDAGHLAPWDAPRHIIILLGPMIGLLGGVVVGAMFGVYLAKRGRPGGGAACWCSDA